ncbi:mandelate racemase/muconate lactonizing enzyme family protein [Jiangella asiatica]|nr:mandelate racemase/muconate lactonizing enzyme family protein [Jiangella asiatica]
MRIVDVTTVLLTGPCTDDPWLLPFKQRRSAAFIEVRTGDPGYVGVGETYAGYFFPESVPLVVDYLRPILVADDAAVTGLDVPTLVRRMRTCCAYWGRVGLGAAVIAGIEAALWDLKGKLEGVPVYELLGGRRHDQLPAYATGGPAPWPETRMLEKVGYYRSLGFRAVKLSSGYLDLETREEVAVGRRGTDAVAEVEVSKLAAIRREFGPDLGVLLDGHMGHRESALRWDADTAAAVLAALAPYGVRWFEEPLPYGDLAGYARLVASSPVRVAGGEQLSTAAEFEVFAAHRALSIAQPDAAWIGLGEFMQVAMAFDDAGLAIAPHAWGAGAAVMQNVHGAFAAPNTDIVEAPPAAGPLHREIWGDSFRLVDGVLYPPPAPGLGVTLTDEIKQRFPFVPGVEEFSSVPGKVMRS